MFLAFFMYINLL